MELFFTFIANYATSLNRALKKLVALFYSDDAIWFVPAKVTDFLSKVVGAFIDFLQFPASVEARRINLLLFLLNSHVNEVYGESRSGNQNLLTPLLTDRILEAYSWSGQFAYVVFPQMPRVSNFSRFESELLSEPQSNCYDWQDSWHVYDVHLRPTKNVY